MSEPRTTRSKLRTSGDTTAHNGFGGIIAVEAVSVIVGESGAGTEAAVIAADGCFRRRKCGGTSKNVASTTPAVM